MGSHGVLECLTSLCDEINKAISEPVTFQRVGFNITKQKKQKCVCQQLQIVGLRPDVIPSAQKIKEQRETTTGTCFSEITH